MKKPFEVGERVAWYDTRWNDGEEAYVKRMTGTIEAGPNIHGVYLVELDKKFHPLMNIAAHPRDMVRLKKKERIAVWFSKSQLETYLGGPRKQSDMPRCEEQNLWTDGIQFREVVRKK